MAWTVQNTSNRSIWTNVGPGNDLTMVAQSLERVSLPGCLVSELDCLMSAREFLRLPTISQQIQLPDKLVNPFKLVISAPGLARFSGCSGIIQK